MNSEEVFLKQNVIMEPLFNQWYAWPYLISPASAAMYVSHQHVKLMQSFISAPQIHIAALENPAMIGGPFINYDAGKTGVVKELLEQTMAEQSDLFALADAIRTLDEMLSNEASGYSLEPLYQKVPDILRGYVELTYDLHNNPSFRLIEALLYKSRYYNKASQSIMLSLADSDDRPFVFSTPRLANQGALILKLPFDDVGLDELSKMKDTPQPFALIKELLHVKDEDAELFSSFFTKEKPPPRASYEGDDIRIRYFGHACIMIETREVSILCDPVISYAYDNGTSRYLYSDLPESIDYLVITHNHQDHCMFETLLQLRHKVKNVVVPRNNGGGLIDPSLKLILQSIGFKNVIEIDELDPLEVDGGEITGLPFFGEHADLNIRTKMAYHINLKGRSILCAADSNNIEPRLYQRVHELLGNIDVLFIGMECDGAPMSWLYGPLLTTPLTRKMDQSRRFDGSNYDKAKDIVDRFNPTEVYVYAMGQEPWLTFLTSIKYTAESRPIVESDRLVEYCTSRDLTSERLFCQKEIFLEANVADDPKLGQCLGLEAASVQSIPTIF
jgi:L-ascorbate metabolism protein UlaG (beta-lactamase superfamily)